MSRYFVFDVFGTLLDVQSTAQDLQEDMGDSAARVMDVWRAKQLEYSWVAALSNRYEHFWTLTNRALDYAFHVVGVKADETLRGRFLDVYRKPRAYPDAVEVLRKLHQSNQLASVLSNGNRGMLDLCLGQAGISELVDTVFSVEGVKIFKPHASVYAMVTGEFCCSPEDITFLSSNAWDIAGANAYGFRPVWVNRSGLRYEYPGIERVRAIPDLTYLEID